MYLSRLILNPQNRQVQSEGANRYELHRTIMSAFPEELPDDERVLFRLEIDTRTGVPVLLVQSHSRPDWSWAEVKRDYLLPPFDPGVANPDVKAFELEFADGQRFYFRLRANPTVKRQGKRYGLYREEEQLDWLRRKAEAGGFQVVSVRTSRERKVGGWAPGNSTKRKLTLLSVQFDGVLQVIDPDKLRASVRQGIGSGKGFGFGLLSLAKG